jgi:DNA-binding transcriptional LysR family regulator
MMRRFDPVQLGTIEIFLKAAETLSFSNAAKELGLGAPAVSRSIGRLENRLGTRLFARSTRRTSLTPDGQLYREQCSQALAQIADVEDILGGRRGAPTGVVRISVPTTYAHYRLIPMLPTFKLLYPDVRLEMSISNRNIDFADSGFDLAIRMGRLPDSALIARRLEDAPLGVFAAPAYLAQHGAPQTLAELKDHRLALFERPSSGRALPWEFRAGAREVDLALKSDVMFSEDFLGCVNFALAGGGLVQAYAFIAEQYVCRGDLVEVLVPFRGRTRAFSLLYAENRYLPPRVRAFIDFLTNAPAYGAMDRSKQAR